jgi:hypothetical protein
MLSALEPRKPEGKVMLLIDGVKYQEWEISDEDELEQMVIEHAQDIFGENSIYFDKKQKLKSLAGVGSIPDGLVIMFGSVPQWHIVEVELSSHDPYAHIVPQVDKFINGIDNQNTRNKLVDTLYNVINSDELLKRETRQAIGLDKDIHKFLADLITTPPTITIIIEKDTDQLEEALRKYAQKKVREFQTFTRAGIGLAVHAHLFEPLCEPKKPPVEEAQGWIYGRKVGSPPGNSLDITINNATFKNSHLIFIPKDRRRFFPGYKVPFTLETDVGTIQTHVSSAREGTRVGDPDAGVYIQSKLADWYRAHSGIKIGDKVRFVTIEPMKRYRLEIVK